MSDSWQSAWVEVLPDFKNFKKTANSEMSGTLGAAGTAGGVVAGKNMGQGLLGGIKGIAGPLLAAVAALGIGRLIGETIGSSIRFGLDGIDLASDLSETKSAIQQVFGDAAKDIEAFALNANKSLGQTQQQALSASQTFGVFAKSAGLTGTPLADFSTGLTTLSADLASFYNTDPQEAIDAIGAGLRGESEPLRRFGVLLDDATLKQRALELGIFDGSGALTAQQRILAAQSEIFAQTGIAQGDFARTSDGLANGQKILASSFEDAQTKLGEALLPTMLLFTDLANDTLIPILNEVIAEVGPELAEALKESAPAFVDLVKAIAPLIPDLVKLAADVLPIMLPLLTTWAEYTSGVVGAVSNLINLLSGDISLQEYFDRIETLSGAFGDLIRWLTLAGDGFGEFVKTSGDNVQRLQSTIVGTVSGFGSLLFNSGRALIDGFIRGVESMLIPAGNAVSGVMDWVKGFFPHSPAERGPFSGAGWAAVGSAGAAIADEFASGFNSRPQINLGVAPQRVSLAGVQSGQSALTEALGSRGSSVPEVKQYITTQDTDPRLFGRQMGREYVRERAG